MREYIQTIAIFLIFSSIVSMLLPNKKYESYVKLTMGIIFIFIVLSPIARFINEGFSMPNFGNIQAEQQNMLAEIENANAQQIMNIMAQYREILDESLADFVSANSDFIVVASHFEIDYYDNFGDILSISLRIEEKPSQNQRPPFLAIEPIRINNIINSGGLPQPTETTTNPRILELKNAISSFYNLDITHIVILGSF